MSHVCCYQGGECFGCADEAHAEELALVKRRGRWLVVFEGGDAVRLSSRRRAVAMIRAAREFCRARLIRYRRDRVVLNEDVPQYEVNDERWLP